MNWPEIQIESWSHFVELMSQFDFGRPSETPRLYRGQSNSKWGLEDSLSRLLSLDVPFEEAVEIEKMAFDRFFAQAHFFLDPSTLPKRCSILAWWGIMQHFGCPTRLLDWTASPYVAAYFAVAEREEDEGVVWSFDPAAVMDASSSAAYDKARSVIRTSEDTRPIFWGSQPIDSVLPFSLTKHHVRVSTQQGGFTVCGRPPRDHGRLVVQALGESAKGYCTKLLIRPNQKLAFLRNLMRMNITANSLFPGLDGLGRSIGQMIKLEVSYERLG
jgi:hypothetical protein